MIRRRSFVNPLIVIKSKNVFKLASSFLKLYVKKYGSITYLTRHKLLLRKKFFKYIYIFYIFFNHTSDFQQIKLSYTSLYFKTYTNNVILFYDLQLHKISLLNYFNYHTFYFVNYDLKVAKLYCKNSNSFKNQFYLTSFKFNYWVNLVNLQLLELSIFHKNTLILFNFVVYKFYLFNQVQNNVNFFNFYKVFINSFYMTSVNYFC